MVIYCYFLQEWRARQIASGEAQDNANFVPLGGDWCVSLLRVIFSFLL